MGHASSIAPQVDKETKKAVATTESSMGTEVGMRLLHPPSLITSRRRRGRNHQAQTLKQHYRTLRRCTPDELATLALAVLYVDVASGILQAAILEGAVDEDPLVKNQVLVFEDLVFVSSHQRTRLPLPGSCRKVVGRRLRSIHRRSDEAGKASLFEHLRTRGGRRHSDLRHGQAERDGLARRALSRCRASA